MPPRLNTKTILNIPYRMSRLCSFDKKRFIGYVPCLFAGQTADDESAEDQSTPKAPWTPPCCLRSTVIKALWVTQFCPHPLDGSLDGFYVTALISHLPPCLSVFYITRTLTHIRQEWLTSCLRKIDHRPTETDQQEQMAITRQVCELGTWINIDVLES